jgi:8-oxo-dGTP pyrophosphatase MutT (NUDIX family)
MLVRPSAGSFEVYMLRRSGKSAFAPDAYVFPGGTLDPSDTAERTRERLLIRQNEDVEYTGLFVAAIREVFEEAGLLFAARKDGTPIDEATFARYSDELVSARGEVHRGERTFSDVLHAFDVYADARELRLFSHWITPPIEPRRYNTHFFLARAPQAQTALADARETHDGRWIVPRRALDEYHAGELHLIYPTIKHLERLASFDDIEALFAFALTKPIITITPDVSAERGFTMPSELEHNW